MRASTWPSKGASKLRVQGALVVPVGSNEKLVEKKDVALVNGVDLGVGVISKPREPFAGTKKPKSVISRIQEFVGEKAFKSLVFLDAQGNIDCRERSGWSEVHWGG
jgi:hypothetical protein